LDAEILITMSMSFIEVSSRKVQEEVM
jgi:hypothetical protein